MKKSLILLSVLTLTLSFSPMTFAESEMKGECPCKRMEHMKKLTQGLNLTADQKKQIDAIKEDAKKQMMQLHEQKMALKKQFHDLITADKLDESKVDELVNKKKEIYAEKVRLMVETKNKIYNVLNAEQKQKFENMMDKWQQKRMDAMKKMQNQNDNSVDAMDDDD
ncbi:Spy/CpxP family protein refolding chaperone [Legionella impletisoli]|uniref:ATP-independent periplasmic protein-refolding chaperone n=1 Tax=Legionella impletisoli TaxID=343510 RepID=A0A917JNQ3_9GAMM|nr:Spy/CpxP family protein refolding chaperone [Legionella impletisoli]GGI75714.1 ATP-independent periplasmic protein-refolding chaperone [Legionella impletisoli]